MFRYFITYYVQFLRQESEISMSFSPTGSFGQVYAEQQQAMAESFDLDAEGVDASTLGKASVELAGVYHFAIVDATNHFTITADDNEEYWRPHVLAKCQVLQSVAGQSKAGSTYWHRIRFPFSSDKERNLNKDASKPPRFQFDTIREETLEFLLGIGILEKREGKVIDPSTGSTKIDHNSLATRLKGRQFIGRIKHRSYVNGKGVTVNVYELSYGRGASLVSDPSNAEVPMNADALKAAGLARAVVPAVGKTGSAPAAPAAQSPAQQPQTQQTPQAPPSVGGMSVNDL